MPTGLLRYNTSRDLQRNLIQRSPKPMLVPSTDISKADEYRNAICGSTERLDASFKEGKNGANMIAFNIWSKTQAQKYCWPLC